MHQNDAYDPNDPNTWVAFPPPSVAATGGWISHFGLDPNNLDNYEEVKLEPYDPTPKHCGEKAKWVNQGVGFRYWLCQVCKEEVEHSDNDPILSRR